MMDNQEQTFRREYGAADGISVLYQNTDSFPKPEGCIYMVRIYLVKQMGAYIHGWGAEIVTKLYVVSDFPCSAIRSGETQTLGGIPGFSRVTQPGRVRT